MSVANTATSGPVTTVPTSRTPQWKVVAIAAVAILALGIGAALGAHFLRGTGAGLGAASAYVPADTVFYMEFRVEPSADQDAALRQILGRFPPIEGIDLDQPLYEQLTTQMDEVAAESAAGLSWSEDVAPWFDGTVSVALTDIDALMVPPSDPTAAPATPGVVMFVGVSDAAEASAAIDRFAQSSSVGSIEITESEYAGVTVHEVGGQAAYAIADDQMLIAPTVDGIREALDTRSSGSSLSASQEAAALASELPSDWLMMGFFDMRGMMEASLLQSGSTSPETTAALEELLAAQPLHGAFSLSADEAGIVMDFVSDLPTGAFAPQNAELGLVDEVPGDALYYVDGGNLGQSLAAAIEQFKAAGSADPAIEEQISTAEAALGAEVEELVSWIGDGAFVAGWNGTEPYAGALLVPNDVAAAQRRLGQLASFAELAASDAASGITVSESEVGSVTVTTIRWENPGAVPMDPMMMLPSISGVVVEYAVTDDRAVIGFGDGFVQRTLELDAANSLAAQARYSDAVAQMGGATNSGVVWIDITGTREAAETGLASMLEMSGGAYESEIRPWLMPFDRIVGVSRVDGDHLVQRLIIVIE